MDKKSRAPKLLGDFGEGLATYTLIRKGFEVACVDHVGADLIAQRNSDRIAVSVKTRRFRAGTQETRGLVIEQNHVQRLEFFAERFLLEPVLIHIACVDDDRMIHLFMLRITDIKKILDLVEHGYRLRFSPRNIDQTTALPYVDYSCWCNEQIGRKLYADTYEHSLSDTTPDSDEI